MLKFGKDWNRCTRLAITPQLPLNTQCSIAVAMLEHAQKTSTECLTIQQERHQNTVQPLDMLHKSQSSVTKALVPLQGYVMEQQRRL